MSVFLGNSGVLMTNQIILIGIVLYYLVCVPPECEYFKLVYWKFSDSPGFSGKITSH